MAATDISDVTAAVLGVTAIASTGEETRTNPLIATVPATTANLLRTAVPSAVLLGTGSMVGGPFGSY